MPPGGGTSMTILTRPKLIWVPAAIGPEKGPFQTDHQLWLPQAVDTEVFRLYQKCSSR